MFDDNDNKQDQTADNGAAPAADVFSGSQDTPATDDSSSDSTFGAPAVLPSVDPEPATNDSTHSSSTETPEPLDDSTDSSDDKSADESAEDSTSDSSSDNDKTSDDVMTTPPSDDLASMKQEALGHLQPLVAHLDLNPEEEFRTTMMMIQANDDHTLLKKAFEAAKNITDDKARAQALLDVINEINYFTQNAE